MPHEKLKSENYENMGGINRKISQYLTNKTEFLDLQNVDFKTVGALSSFAGYTQFLAGGTSPFTGIANRVNRGTTTFTFFQTYSIIATDAYGVNDVSAGNISRLYQFIYPNTRNPFDFTQSNAFFGTNQWDFFNLQNGGSLYQYSLPKPFFNLGPAGSGIGSTGGLSGNLVVYFAFVRADGFYGPATWSTFSVTGHTGFVVKAPVLYNQLGGTFLDLTGAPGTFGISGMQMWYSLNGSAPKGLSTLLGATVLAGVPTFMINDQFASFAMSVFQPEDYFGTFLYGFSNGCGASSFLTGYLNGNAFNPGCLELFNNQLFSGGFLNDPDDVWYSKIGELEKHDNEGFFEVGFGDGDIVSGLKTYYSNLIIFKINSTWLLTGTDPDNFVLSQVSDQYGTINHRTFCVFQQRLWFLDKKGICEFNGANTKIISEKVEDYFLRMNISAARTEALMLHVKERNEVWCAIPIDGSSTNNIVVIYDYVSDEWTTRTNIRNMSSVALISRGLAKDEVFFSTGSGIIFNFGQSFFTDNGSAYTSVIKSRFLADLGHSVEKQFRRLYVDATIPAGTTQTIAVNFYRDQGISPYQSSTMVLSDFQKRMDLGIPAKDLAVEFIYTQGQYLRLNGFTIEYRFQRAV